MKYLYHGGSKREQYWPYCILSFNIVIFVEKCCHSNDVAGKSKYLLIWNKLVINGSIIYVSDKLVDDNLPCTM